MKKYFRAFFLELTGVSLVVLIIILLFTGDRFFTPGTIPPVLLNINTIFLSILLEAIPFILLGAFASSLIQLFISEKFLRKLLPKHPIAALVPAALVGALIPVCECAIIPVVRRLIQKGMPLHLGVVILSTAPILNPIVAASTYFAFQSNHIILYGRMGVAFVCAIVIGAVIYLIFRSSDQLKPSSHHHSHDHSHTHSVSFTGVLRHAGEEFFDMGRYLIIGSLIASLFSTLLDRSVLESVGGHSFLAPAVMMAFAYFLSLCSEADAFVAATFGTTFTYGSIIAFLVYGPILDLKNTVMMFAYFKTRFVLAFLVVVTVIVYGTIIILQ
ncbi:MULTISPECIES: permease [Bacillus]|uniref:Permease n=2 Tax=Bacillus TaxID=1386 RepID=A0A0M4FNT8_9BACI|nr:MULTISPECIES: permease [Bacillus]ALC80347.1 hypothetical protein AM592_01070 [Bacillus gobiensis]MBP1083811.1 uncharacterized membrane protein YraQ (UPF0718 family) [Bacillus capparidis]MED1098295.1 permease [Bacillus capparidis]